MFADLHVATTNLDADKEKTHKTIEDLDKRLRELDERAMDIKAVQTTIKHSTQILEK